MSGVVTVTGSDLKAAHHNSSELSSRRNTREMLWLTSTFLSDAILLSDKMAAISFDQ
jgi:hypothetical protein